MLVATESWKDLFEGIDSECCSCPNFWSNFKKFMENFAIFIAGSIYLSMFPIAGVFLYCVGMMVLEIVKLSLLPLIFRKIDDKHRSNVRFYKPVFAWLLQASNVRDYNLRLAVANAYCCEDYLENVATSNKKGSWKSNKFMSWLLQAADLKEKEEMIKLREERERKEKEKKEERKKKKKKKKKTDSNENETEENENKENENKENKENENDGFNETSENKNENENENENRENKNEKGGLLDNDDNDGKDDNKDDEKEEQKEEINNNNNNNNKIDAISELLAKTGAGVDNIGTERKESDEIGMDEMKHTIDFEMDFNEKDPLIALGLSGFDIENIIEFRRRPPLLPPDRLQFDYRNLLSIKSSDLRNESDWSFKFFVDKYLSFFREVFDENFERDWQQAQCCGKTIIIVILVVLGTALYVVIPIIILYLIGSLLYPLICLCLTPWHEVALLQKVLTFIYLSAVSLLLILGPRVYKFQHANFHFIAVREGWWYSRSLDAPFQIKKRYVDLIATRIRNEMIETFFGDLSNEMMKFLPNLHQVDEEWVEKVEINIDYSPQFDANVYDYAKSYTVVDFNY